jgi:hypothetical protein
MIEWYLLRLRAFDNFTTKNVNVIDANTIDNEVGCFCEEYLSHRQELGVTAAKYWPGEIVAEVQKAFDFSV